MIISGQPSILRSLIVFASACFIAPTSGEVVWMATDGSDANDGAYDRPLATLSTCAAAAGDGGVCWVRGGRYRVANTR